MFEQTAEFEYVICNSILFLHTNRLIVNYHKHVNYNNNCELILVALYYSNFS